MSHCKQTEPYLYEKMDNYMSKLVWDNIHDKNIVIEKNIQVKNDINIPENTPDKLEFHGTHLNQGLNYRKKANRP